MVKATDTSHHKKVQLCKSTNVSLMYCGLPFVFFAFSGLCGSGAGICRLYHMLYILIS